MVWTTVKLTAAGAVVATTAGLFFFGSDLGSYLSTGTEQVRSSVRDNVPLDFELARARDMLKQVVPELQSNIRLIAQEEVEIERLQADITASEQAIADERSRISKVRSLLNTEQAAFTIAGSRYDRADLTEELGRRFDRFQEAEQVLEGKRRLLDTRQKSLQNATHLLEKTRHQKLVLEDKIAGLEGQFRLVQAASRTSEFRVDDSKIAQTEKLINDIKQRLDVAERVLAHESRFVQKIPIESAIEDHRDVLAEVDAYFDQPADRPAEALVEESAQPEPRAESTQRDGNAMRLSAALDRQ